MAPPATATEKRLSRFFLGLGAWLMSPLPLLLTPLFHRVDVLQPLSTWTWLEIVWLLGSIGLFVAGLILIGGSIFGKGPPTDAGLRISLDGTRSTGHDEDSTLTPNRRE
jgi:hypothetical protein